MNQPGAWRGWATRATAQFGAEPPALGAWQTQSVIAERARHASREDFLRFMEQVPDHEPVEGDKVK